MDSDHPQYILQIFAIYTSPYKTMKRWVMKCVEHFQEPRRRKTPPPSSSASPPKKAAPKPKPAPVKAVKVAKTAPVKTLGAWWTLGVSESGVYQKMSFLDGK